MLKPQLFAVLAVVGLSACSGPTTPPPCGPASCQGCCAIDGTCLGGTAVLACGLNGVFCQNCTSVGVCSLSGRCEPSATAGGSATSGGSAGGSAGGSTAGGSSAGGAAGGGSTAGGVAGGGSVAGGVTAGGSTAGGTAGGASGGTAGGVIGGGTAGGVVVGGGSTAGGSTAGGAAGGPPPAGNTCAAPIDIVLSGGSGLGVGTRVSATDEAAGSCGGVGAGDLVFRFTTSSVGTVTIDLRSTSAQQQLVGFLRTSCDTSAAELPASCVSAQAPGGGLLLVQRGLPAGTYFLWVDGVGAASAGVSVNVNFTAEQGDTCASPITLTPTNEEVNVVGTTAGALTDSTGTCGGSGADVVYRLDLTSQAALDVSLSTRNLNVQPVVYVRSTTCTGTQLACGAALSAGQASSVRLGSLAAGSYFIWVDSVTANAGEYVLRARLTPPVPGDTCLTAKPLTFTMASGVLSSTETGDTSLATNDTTGTCASGVGGDVVYSFTTTSTLDLRATVTTANSLYRPAVYVRSSSCTGSERVCAASLTAGGSAQLVSAALPAGTWFLWVDGVSGTAGAFTLTTTLTPPVPGDSCSNPVVLTLTPDGGTVTTSGDTSQLLNDMTPSCASGVGGDAVYSFTTTQPGDLRLSVTPTSLGYQPVVTVRSSSCLGTERGCAAAPSFGSPANLLIGGITAGTYFIWVDGSSGTAGQYTLSATLTAPTPGDGCLAPKLLAFGADGGTIIETGDTSALFNDASGSCASGLSGDAVYQITTTTMLDLRATATSTSPGYRPALSLRNASCTGTERTCNGAPGLGNSTSVAAAALPAGTYFLWVDGVSGTSGVYSLTVTLTPPAPGETCANPLPLVFGATGGSITEVGDTSTRFHEITGNCISGTSPDVAYSFSTTTPLDLRATVSTSSTTYQPAVYLRTATCSSEFNCGAAQSLGGTASVGVGALAPGTYTLVVDGAAASSGPYTLNATLSPPVVGDSCTNPRTLLFSGTDGGVAADIGDTTTLFHESNGSCTSGTGADAVYTFTTTGVFDFRATATTTSAGFRPALYLRSTCSSSERACNAATIAGGAATISSALLPAGTYFLWVDGASSTVGTFALSASLGVPIAGEACVNAVPLSFVNGAVTVTGDTTLAFNDLTPACASTAIANDVVYTFTTSTTQSFTARATTTSGTYRPTLSLRSATCTGIEQACQAAAVAGGDADLALPMLAPGTYFLWVDGAGGTAGPFTVSATLGTAPPDEVRALAPMAVTAPGPMTVVFQVFDRFNNLVTSDTATSFTVNVTGGATFTGATQGTVLSGVGTSSVLVRVSGGEVRLQVSSASAQTVTFTAIDSQSNGLRYPGASVSLVGTPQPTPCDTRPRATFNFPTGFVPQAAGSVRVVGRGDFDLSTEYLNVYVEGSSPLGSVFVGGNQCSSELNESLAVPLATLQSALLDGTVTVALEHTTSVNCGLCTPTALEVVNVTLSYPSSITGQFQ